MGRSVDVGVKNQVFGWDCIRGTPAFYRGIALRDYFGLRRMTDVVESQELGFNAV